MNHICHTLDVTIHELIDEWVTLPIWRHDPRTHGSRDICNDPRTHRWMSHIWCNDLRTHGSRCIIRCCELCHKNEWYMSNFWCKPTTSHIWSNAPRTIDLWHMYESYHTFDVTTHELTDFEIQGCAVFSHFTHHWAMSYVCVTSHVWRNDPRTHRSRDARLWCVESRHTSLSHVICIRHVTHVT